MRRARRFARRLGFALLVAASLFVALSWWASGSLLSPARNRPHTPTGLALEELALHTDDGLRLAAWVLEPASGRSRGTVLLLHGKDGCRQAGRMAWLAARGFRSLAWDARGHGESEGEFTGFGWTERLDVAAAMVVVRERWPDDALLGWGTSQGAVALVAYLDPRWAPSPERPFAGLILESLYTDIDTAFRNRVELHLGSWAMPGLALARELVVWRGGVRPEAMRPVDSLPRLAGIPLLLATGALDRHATPREMQQLATAAPWARTQLVAGRGHENLLSEGETGVDPYGRALEALLDAVAPWPDDESGLPTGR